MTTSKTTTRKSSGKLPSSPPGEETDWTHAEVEPGDAFVLADGRVIVVLTKETYPTTGRRRFTTSEVTWLDGGAVERDAALLGAGDPSPIFCWGTRL